MEALRPEERCARKPKRCSTPASTAPTFLDAIRNYRRPSADIEIGHYSAALPHLANILARTGRGQLTFDPKPERFVDAPDADALIGRTYREGHWARL